MQASGEVATPQRPSVSFSIPAALLEGDHSTDLVFTMEGHPLHFPKAVLTLCSPVFHALLTPEFVQQHSEGIPLEGKKYGSVAFFLIQLHPVFTAVTPMRDDMLLETLALAKEYQVDHLNAKCEQYIGSQLQLHDYNNKLTVDTILTYLTACDQNSLAKHREKLVSLAATHLVRNLQSSEFFEPVPATALKDVFLARCAMLENDLESLKQKTAKDLLTATRDLSSLKQKIINGLKTARSEFSCALQTLPPKGADMPERYLREGLEKIDSLKKSLN